VSPGRGDGFWDIFDSDDDGSDGIVYGNIPDEFHRVYEDIVSESPVYDSLSDEEKYILAEDWEEMFIYGGVTREDMVAWFEELDLDIESLTDTQYAELYDSIYG
jgi:hypothetical protein